MATPKRGPLDELDRSLERAERKAWRALAGGNYARFGHWASLWKELRRLSGHDESHDPWQEMQRAAQRKS